MKFIEITDIEYNALKEENSALKKALLESKKKRENEKIKPVPVSVPRFKTYQSLSYSINDIHQTILKIEELISCTSLQLADAEIKASYFEARYVEELKSVNRSMVFGSTKKSKESYANIVLRCKNDLSKLVKSKENFEKLLNDLKEKENKQNEENSCG